MCVCWQLPIATFTSYRKGMDHPKHQQKSTTNKLVTVQRGKLLREKIFTEVIILRRKLLRNVKTYHIQVDTARPNFVEKTFTGGSKNSEIHECFLPQKFCTIRYMTSIGVHSAIMHASRTPQLMSCNYYVYDQFVCNCLVLDQSFIGNFSATG